MATRYMLCILCSINMSRDTDIFKYGCQVSYQTVEVNYMYTVNHRIIGTPDKMCKNEYLKGLTHTISHILPPNIWGHYVFVSAGENNSLDFLPVMANKVDGNH